MWKYELGLLLRKREFYWILEATVYGFPRSIHQNAETRSLNLILLFLKASSILRQGT